MDDDRTRLTERERRVLAELELQLRREDPDLERSFHSRVLRRRGRGPRPARWAWWSALALGVLLMVAGMLAGAVVAGALGFVVVLVSIHELTAHVRPGGLTRRLRVWFGVDPERPT